jgi:hypothetical protein
MSSQPGLVRVISSVASNAAIIAESIIINPTQSSTVNLYVGGNAAEKKPVPLPLFYKWLTGVIFAAAVLCLVSSVWLGFVWPHPTEAQANIMSNLADAWKTGFGFAIGLITGKSVP